MQEIVVDPHTGQWYTVGDSGAELRNIPKGAIVFNHLQSKSILENGWAVGRATALAGGTAMVTGGIKIANVKRSTGSVNKSATTTSSKSTASSNSSYTSASSASSAPKASSSSNSSSSETEEKFDWIETAIKRVEEAIERVKIKADSAYKVLSVKNSAVADEIQLITQQIDLQSKAYDRYIAEANAIGLSSDWVSKIKNGSIETSTITDKNLAEKIKNYKELYEKAVEVKDAIAELHESIADLYVERFDNIIEDYENQLSLVEHMIKTYENGIDQLETAGMKGATAYYEYLMDAEAESIKIMKDQLATMEDAFAQAMNSKEIEMYSDAWYDMMGKINDTRESIEEATNAMMEYANALRELEWDYFDYTEERISNIITETEFLIDLLSNEKLFDDNGKLTKEGTATLGLHGENYNIYMSQADDYAEEIKKINSAIAEDPTNTDLLARRQKLIELQQDAIRNAQSEKQAIADLIKDGYDAQVDALKELIDTYNDSLNSAKDLYDYQKKLKEQTQTVSNLQKQLNAYQNDTSGENRARLQKIQVDLSKAMEELQETQYEQYLEDQHKMLDSMLDQAENIFNLRVDDIDALISETIDTINADSTNIADTITQAAEKVGYTISDENRAIWENDGQAASIMAKYGDNFGAQLTSINASINGIKAYTDILLAKANAEAAAKKAKEEAARKKAEEASKPKPVANTTSNTPTKSNAKFSEDIKKGVAAAIWVYNGAGSGWGNDPERSRKLTEKFGADNAKAIQQYLNAHANNGDLYRYWASTGYSKLSQYYYSAFKTGARSIIRDQDAWTQENGQELILRPTENAMLTSMKKGDTVLNAEMTDRIWEFAKNPRAFINSNGMNFGGFIGGSGKVGNNVGDINITIPIDHVDDYNDFVDKLQKDPTFEKMLHAMTIDQLVGGSKLAKYKYNFKK